ncbi:MAG: DNA cytosine methyltransferase [Crocinitomicaceae bacterium]
MIPKQQNGINVLSLFDGISCAKLALKKNDIQISNYYSSEISEPALRIQNYNFSGDTTFHSVGDVTKINGADYAHCHLAIAGSPCTQLSSVNSVDKSGLEGKDSSLFYEFVRIIKEIKQAKPQGEKLFILLENVASMPSKEKEKITEALSEAMGEPIEPIKIQSSLIAPASRSRLYWSNLTGLTVPQPIQSDFQDVLVNGYTDKKKANVVLSNNVTLTNGIYRHYKRSIGNIVYQYEDFAKLPTFQKLLDHPAILEKSEYKGRAGSAQDEYSYPNGCYRLTSILEEERMMTIPEGHVSCVSDVSKTEKHKAIGLSFTVDVVAHLIKDLPNQLRQNER